jgi:hypothetical protein
VQMSNLVLIEMKRITVYLTLTNKQAIRGRKTASHLVCLLWCSRVVQVKNKEIEWKVAVYPAHWSDSCAIVSNAAVAS